MGADFQMEVADVCIVRDRGTVLTGTVLADTVDPGDLVSAHGIAFRCVGVETFNGRKEVGRNIGVLLAPADPVPGYTRGDPVYVQVTPGLILRSSTAVDVASGSGKLMFET